jgi:hypothetical protein
MANTQRACRRNSPSPTRSLLFVAHLAIAGVAMLLVPGAGQAMELAPGPTTESDALTVVGNLVEDFEDLLDPVEPSWYLPAVVPSPEPPRMRAREMVALRLIGHPASAAGLASQSASTPNVLVYLLMPGRPKLNRCDQQGRLFAALGAIDRKAAATSAWKPKRTESDASFVFFVLPVRSDFNDRLRGVQAPSLEALCDAYDYDLANRLRLFVARSALPIRSDRLPNAGGAALWSSDHGGPVAIVTLRPLHLLGQGDRLIWLDFGRFTDGTMRQVVEEVSAYLMVMNGAEEGELRTMVLTFLDVLSRLDSARGWFTNSLGSIREVGATKKQR